MVSANLTELLAIYIDALHILHQHSVLDGYGHLSVRNPDHPPTFFMMHQLAPALVSGLDDIGEYRISDAEPVNSGTPPAPLERYIHSEILKRYPEVNVVLHGHPDEVVAYGISSVKLRPVIHMAPFLGEEVPVFDITRYYQPNDTQDFLVRNQRLGAALAAEFDGSSSFRGGDAHYQHDDSHNDSEANDVHTAYPVHNLVLMQSHGFAAVATDIMIATYEGVYALTNAKIQSEAMKIQHAYTGQAVQGVNDIVSLDERQVLDSWATESQIVEKPWATWVKEVRVDPLYVNKLADGEDKEHGRGRT